MKFLNSLSKVANRSPKPRFVDIIGANTILVVSLEDVAIVILRSLMVSKPSSSLMQTAAIDTWSAGYPREIRSAVSRKLTEAWQLLLQRGLIAPTKVMGTFESWFVTDRGKKISEASQIAFGKESLLPRGLLNAILTEKTLPLYLAGRFDDAYSSAFKQLEILVRRLGNAADSDVGRDLMEKAFKPTIGSLTDTGALMAEQLGARELMTGAISYYRNTFAHRNVEIGEAQAASIILMANELMAVAMIHATVRSDEAAAAGNTESV